MNRYTKWFLGVLLLILLSTQAMALIPDRRAGSNSNELGWFVAPTPMRIEGIGQAINLFGLVSNFYESTDAMLLKTLPGGDFEFGGGFVDELPLFTEHLQFTGGLFSGELGQTRFKRGIDSDGEDFVLPYFQQNANFYELNAFFWEKRIHLFYQLFKGDTKTLKIFDKDGNEISSEESESNFEGKNFGTLLDFTDDWIDPRKGIIVGQKYRPVEAESTDQSDILVTDTSLSAFIPMFGSDTLVVDFFLSTSSITRQGLTDKASIRALVSLNCDTNKANYADCKNTEDQQVSDYLAYNKYGQATSLGGSNRLRSYPMGRYFAGNSSYRGIEYRYNFSSEKKPINLYLLGGVETLMQIAFFYEQGTVAEFASELNQNMKSSYGMGFRAIISGFVYRFDVAMGDEGPGITLFFDYPMKLVPLTG